MGTLPAMADDVSSPDTSLTWIFGSSRSGSTWLSRMLGELAGVTVVDDPHLGHHLGVWRPIPLAWATASEVPPLRTLPEIKAEREGYFFNERYRDAWQPALRTLIAERFAAQAAEDEPGPDGRRHVVVKEPGSQAAGLLLDLFPDSNLLFLVRDGRDVIDSWLDAYSEGSWAIEEGAYPVAERGRVPLVEWLATVWVTRMRIVRECFERHDRGRRLLLRYEEMRRDPARVLREIRDTTGLADPDALLEEVAERHAFERTARGERGRGKEIRQARPGGWRRGLDEEEARAASRIMDPTLAELGYETAAAREPVSA